MNYLTGYTIKPFRTTSVGVVIFTDGTNNEISPNQLQCQAYGYTYDPATATCRSFTPNANFQRNLNNIDNKINGAQNTIGTGGKNIQINGTNNTAEGLNNNCFISGINNTIANGVSNATIVGRNGTAIRDGEFVIGTGIDGGDKSTFFLNGTTTDAVSTSLFVNGDTAVTTIARLPDTLYIAEINLYAYRTGGTSGSGAVGDSAYFFVKALINGTTLTQTMTAQLSLGSVSGWLGALTLVGSDLKLKATGAANMDITWAATANFYAMKI